MTIDEARATIEAMIELDGLDRRYRERLYSVRDWLLQLKPSRPYVSGTQGSVVIIWGWPESGVRADFRLDEAVEFAHAILDRVNECGGSEFIPAPLHQIAASESTLYALDARGRAWWFCLDEVTWYLVPSKFENTEVKP